MYKNEFTSWFVLMFLLILAVVFVLSIDFTPPEVVHKSHAFERKMFAEVSAYTSREVETDSTPHINAAGLKPKLGDVACPDWLELGSKVEINGQIYTCNDRMHARYRAGAYFDLLMADTKTALEWGRQTLQIIVVK